MSRQESYTYTKDNITLKHNMSKHRAYTRHSVYSYPMLCIGCILWWDYVPENAQAQVLDELQRWEEHLKSSSGQEITGIDERMEKQIEEGSTPELQDQIPKERRPRKPSQWRRNTPSNTGDEPPSSSTSEIVAS